MRLVTPAQMREMDRRTIDDVGIPGIVLMERAALGAVDALIEHFDLGAPARIALVCGSGNNGGDGLAMSRLLANLGHEALIVLLADPARLQGDAAANYVIARALDLPILPITDAARLADTLESLGPIDIWCDALLGTGLDRDVEGLYAKAIEFLNDRLEPVFAVDIPSGIDGLTGAVKGVAVEADATATFGFPKIGQALYPGRHHCATLYTLDIGIPPCVANAVGYEALLLTEDWAAGLLAPRPVTFHKGDAGRLLILAGSVEQSGAALMTTRGALYSGAGLLTVGTVKELITQIPLAVAEAMSAAVLAEDASNLDEERLEGLVAAADVVAMGPGMGTSSGATRALEIVLASTPKAAVFDADALNLLARRKLVGLSQFAENVPTVLSPHPGEMARLVGVGVKDIVARPVAYARELAMQTGAVVILKIAATVIAGPHGDIAINTTGNPGMGTGGMGDALTGIIAARLVDVSDPFEAASIAVYAHGRAADEAARETGQLGLSVGALLEALPAVWRALEP